MLTNIDLLKTYKNFYSQSLSLGFCRITKTPNGSILITADRKNGRTSVSCMLDNIVMDIKRVCFVSPKRAKLIIDTIDEILKDEEQYYIIVDVVKGSKVIIKETTLIGKVIKKRKIKLFSINIR